MREWKGLNSGGVEQLWDAEIIQNVLMVFAHSEPLRYYDENADFYLDLEDKYPDITWRNTNADGSFRPIFRKADPLLKLRLIDKNSETISVSDLGHELLSGEKSLQEVYVEILKTFMEADETQPFALICFFGLNFPEKVVTLEDIEFAISQVEEFDAAQLSKKVLESRQQKVIFPIGSRRPRIVRRIMASLVSSGAFKTVDGGFLLADSKIATEIAHIAHVEPTEQSSTRPVPEKETKPKQAQSCIKTIKQGKRAAPTITASESSVTDNIKRALLLERANSIHEKIVEEIANTIRALGGDPLEDLNSFDIATLQTPNSAIIEAKYVNPKNAISQVRKAISQLHEYNWRHKKLFGPENLLIIAINTAPRDVLDEDYITYIYEDRKMLIIGPANQGYVDHFGRKLEDILSLSR